MQDKVIATALQRYLVDKRIEAAHNGKDSDITSKQYATLLSAIEETCDAFGVPRDDDTLEAIRQQRPGCHHA